MACSQWLSAGEYVASANLLLSTCKLCMTRNTQDAQDFAVHGSYLTTYVFSGLLT